jgi:fructokinase
MDNPDSSSPAPLSGNERPLIVGLGEALVDRLPDGEVIGGAPLNVAVQASQLGNTAAVISRVGHDAHGSRIVQKLRGLGVDTRGIQVDAERPTGTVEVGFDEHAELRYTIVGDVAWDHYRYDTATTSLAADADAIGFGSLAHRNPTARNRIGEFVRAAQKAVVLFDVNLRLDYFDRDVIESSLRLASSAKCNESELRVVTEMLGLGDEPVGAGDSVSAALLHGAVREWPWKMTVALANRLGAYIASRRGACPPLSDELIMLATAQTNAGGCR